MLTKVITINQLADNYSYLILNKKNNKAIIVDPSDEIPIINFLKANNIDPIAILVTHDHADHTSGIKGLKKIYKIDVYSPNRNIEKTNYLIKDKEKINFNFIEFEIISTPGHTLDHVIYYCKKEKILFSGDTLFYYGCGRVFEGTNKQMLNSLNKIKDLSDDIMIYCGHEYTYKNLEFVLDELVSWKNKNEIKQKIKNLINTKGTSIPFDLGHQKKWNPFLNCNNIKYRQEICNYHKNRGKIALDAGELEFFSYIREKRNIF